MMSVHHHHPKQQLFVVLLLASCLYHARFAKAQTCGEPWTCSYTTSAPTLDADLADWDDVNPYVTSLAKYTGETYQDGDASYKCVYDDTHIYFALEIPGMYRFNATDNHFCAAIGTMMKIGEQATFMNMGGCPDALDPNGCDSVPDTCLPYRVDIGAHWELRTTEQGVLYDVNTEDGSGNDLIANKDDEYGVSSYCRFDDDDADTGAGNEWAGAWRHTDPVEGEPGSYIFELSRTLTTQSDVSDAQIAPGETYEFGVAYWDPYEITATGWTDAGHYLTGCGNNWINLELLEAPNGDDTSASSPKSTMFHTFTILVLMAAWMLVVG